MSGDRIATTAARLLAARANHERISLGTEGPADAAEAYAVQDAVTRALGPVGGWKVGAKGPDAEPTCAPLPAAGILASPAKVIDGAWRVRGIETEVAVRFAADLPADPLRLARETVLAAVGEVLCAIEVVETRLAEFPKAAPLQMLADSSAHGALVLGAARPFDARWLDAKGLVARQWFDGSEVATTTGGNPAVDLARLLVWVARQAAARGMPIRAGQVVTTGSFTGMLFAPPGARVHGAIEGLGECALAFAPTS